MAGGAFEDGATLERAHLYEYKTTSYLVFACLAAAMGGSLSGYDLGVSGGVTSMDDFLKKFFPQVYDRKQQYLHETDYCKDDNQIITLFTSSLYFGALVSTIGASFMSKNKGRRASIICGALSFFCGAVINAFAVNIAMLIIGRLLLGVGIGFSNQAVPLYLSEMSPAKTRGRYNQLFQLTSFLGTLVAILVSYETEKLHPWGWRLSLGSATIPAVLMGVGAIFIPETPNSLVEQGKLEEGRRILEKIRGTTNVYAEFADLIDASKEAKAIKNPFSSLLKPKNRPQLIIGALGIPMFQQLTGMNFILFYASVFFQSLGFGEGTSISLSVTLVVGALTSMALVDKFGRRTLFIEASIEMFCYMTALAITLALTFGKGVTLPKAGSVFLVIIMCLFCFAYGRSWGPLGWLVPSELFLLGTRSAGQSIAVCVNIIFATLMAQSFLVFFCHLRYGIFFLFAGLVAIMGTFIFFLLPETKQVPIDEGRSWEPLGWLVPSELFPMETRLAGQSIVVCVNMIFTALIAQCFLVSLCHLRYGIFFLFAGLVAIMGTFIFFLLPETKQVPIEEVYLLFQNHWFWKKIVGDGTNGTVMNWMERRDKQIRINLQIQGQHLIFKY